jgi:hypothetical protein
MFKVHGRSCRDLFDGGLLNKRLPGSSVVNGNKFRSHNTSARDVKCVFEFFLQFIFTFCSLINTQHFVLENFAKIHLGLNVK